MRLSVNRLASPPRLTDEPVLAAVERIVPHALVQEVVAAHAPATRRCRRLPAELTLLLVIAMNLYATDALPLVLAKLLLLLRQIWPAGTLVPASKGAISQARARLGPAPVVALFHRVCQPLATESTPGAFLFGLRVVGIDSWTEEVADTPANERAFGRPSGSHGPGSYPQLQVTGLVECGTHAILDAIVGPRFSSPPAAARRLLRRVTRGMLLLVDAGLCHVALVLRAQAKGVQVLGRIGTTLVLPAERGLLDGSYLARLSAAPPSRRNKTTPWIWIRVIVYTLDDPERPGAGETHRLVTTLLDPVAYPARDLVLAYHERWEVELTVDELDTHQRLPACPLRSKTPLGVIQEVYGLLLAHYVVRAVMVDAASQAGLDPDRLSFVRALGLLLTILPVAPLLDERSRETLYQDLLAELRRAPLPCRELRHNPRMVKRRNARYRVRTAAYRPTCLRLPFVHAVQIFTMGASVRPVGAPQPLAA
jgi:Insertion element 4 transposase N-terminal/Transposase DDE domain